MAPASDSTVADASPGLVRRLRKLRSNEVWHPRSCAAISACSVARAHAADSAGVMPLVWKPLAPASSAGQSKASGSRSAKAESAAVVEGRARPRELSDLDEEEPEPAFLAQLHPVDAHPVGACLPEHEPAERVVRKTRDPGGARPEPRQRDGDVELRSGGPELERRRLLEPVMPGRRESQHRLAERDDASFPDR